MHRSYMEFLVNVVLAHHDRITIPLYHILGGYGYNEWEGLTIFIHMTYAFIRIDKDLWQPR